MKKLLATHLKNIPGWRTPRKLVAFAIDDYANVRLASREAREQLVDAGLNLSSDMDRYDAMETRQDLEALFEVLGSVKDANDRSAVFTAYALSANPDFERILESGSDYHYEPITQTFSRLAAEQPTAYEGTWALWKEGMAKGLLHPQFHGREHVNIRLFETKLRANSIDLALNLKSRSLAGLGQERSMPGVGFTQAFACHDQSSTELHQSVLRDGTELFEACYGFRSTTFTPPSQVISPVLYPVCHEVGIRLINKPRNVVRKLPTNQTQRELSWTGRWHDSGHYALVRNVVYEPAQRDARGSISNVMEQVRASFRWRKPAIISSHRVNFCGHIDEANRTNSLKSLNKLLRGIISEWPDAEFVTVDEIADLIAADNAHLSIVPD